MFLSIPTSYTLWRIYIYPDLPEKNTDLPDHTDTGARHKEEWKERIEMDADDIPG